MKDNIEFINICTNILISNNDKDINIKKLKCILESSFAHDYVIYALLNFNIDMIKMIFSHYNDYLDDLTYLFESYMEKFNNNYDVLDYIISLDKKLILDIYNSFTRKTDVNFSKWYLDKLSLLNYDYKKIFNKICIRHILYTCNEDVLNYLSNIIDYKIINNKELLDNSYYRISFNNIKYIYNLDPKPEYITDKLFSKIKKPDINVLKWFENIKPDMNYDNIFKNACMNYNSDIMDYIYDKNPNILETYKYDHDFLDINNIYGTCLISSCLFLNITPFSLKNGTHLMII